MKDWVGRKLSSLGEVLQSTARPVPFLLGRSFRLPYTLEQTNGFRVRIGRENRNWGTTLVTLANHGATFVRDRDATDFEWRIDVERRTVSTPSGLTFDMDSVDPLIFAETFIYETHFHAFDFAGKVVVDAGAYTGDTALYFAQHRAHVIAVEPDPINFHYLLRNLSLNPRLRDLITPINVALGTDGLMKFSSGVGGLSGRFGVGGEVVNVRSMSLRSLIEECRVQIPALLKADVKGSEYDIVSQPEISHFPVLEIEYTGSEVLGDASVLVDALRKRGFTKVRVRRHNWVRTALSNHGQIHAER